MLVTFGQRKDKYFPRLFLDWATISLTAPDKRKPRLIDSGGVPIASNASL
jgi:hypothetical protein